MYVRMCVCVCACFHSLFNPFWSRVVASVTGTAPHARRILIEFAQPRGDQLSVFFP